MRSIPALFAALALGAPAASARSEAAPEPPGQLRFFGYWNAEPGPAHPDDISYLKRMISDTKGYANLVQIGMGARIDEAFAEAKAAGMKALVWAEDVDEKAFEAAVRPHLPDIAAFLVASEPYNRCKTGAEPCAPSARETRRETRERVEARIRFLREAFPGKPLMANFVPESIGVYPGYEWTNDADVPRDLDWISFDEYGCDAQCVLSEMPKRLAKLRATFPGKRYLFLPTAHRDPALKLDFADAELVRIAKNYYRVAYEAHDVIGLVPFVWYSSGYDAENKPNAGGYIAARDIPDVRDEYAQIGKQILAPPPPGPGEGTVCVDVRPEEKRGYFVSRLNGETWGWEGSKCFPGHRTGYYSVRASGGEVAEEQLLLRAGETIRFTVTFPALPPEAPPLLPGDPASEFLAAVRPGVDPKTLAGEVGDKLASPQPFTIWLEGLANTAPKGARPLVHQVLRDKAVQADLLSALRGWFARQHSPRPGMQPVPVPHPGVTTVPVPGPHGVDPRLTGLATVDKSTQAIATIRTLFASMEKDDRLKLIAYCEKTEDCDVARACVETGLYDACRAACAAHAQCVWPSTAGTTPTPTGSLPDPCKQADNSQAAGSAAASGSGEVCVAVENDPGGAYFVVGPKQSWGWNGSKCFPGHPAGVYSVNTNGGYGYAKASVSPRKGTLGPDGRLTFRVRFCRD
ncbi:MAG: hypothetical protein HY553_18780 [Elusimicrobia bacterium]|nr:hypothetical protein [Elusimicrobiota bacterium]